MILRVWVTLFAFVVVLGVRPARGSDVAIPFSRGQLPNGLTVIVHEDHTLPRAVVNLSYDVGSRVEPPHRTGFAHLFEHLMFMGTRRAPTKMFDAWMESVGGANNAWTSEDRTDYYEMGPSSTLPLFLWLEADRMADLGVNITQEKLDAQRAIVRNERRQTAENEPYGIANLRLPELLFPEGHPYHHPILGSHEDLAAATLSDVREFFSTWYDPARASVVIAGDVDTTATMEAIGATLAKVPSRVSTNATKPKPPVWTQSTLTTAVRETAEDNVELPKLVVAWQSPAHFAAGDAELDALAVVLASGKASRLYQALVTKQKLAQSVEAYQNSGVLASRFTIELIARPGVTLDALEKALDAELARMRSVPVTNEELTRARNTIVTGFVYRLESVRERAALLNQYQAEMGDPGYVQTDLDRYGKLTPPQVSELATKVLDPNARVMFRIVPKRMK